MSEDPNDFSNYDVGMVYGFAGASQTNELKTFEENAKREREALNELKRQAQTHGEHVGINSAELAKLLDGAQDPEEVQRKLDVENDRINKEAAQAVADKAKANERPDDPKFPAPPCTAK